MSLDQLLWNDWHVVALSEQVNGKMLQFRLLDQDLVIWRSSEGNVHAWLDRCPHRGAPYSMGTLENDVVTCPYHGLEFNDKGECQHQPAHPETKPAKTICATKYHVKEQYGLVWVCLGTPQNEIFDMPNYGDADTRTFTYGPYEIDASGPRIIENFLDMAHFPYVHAGYLGEVPHGEVKDYSVKVSDDEILIEDCSMWQPAANPNTKGGSMVDYIYWVKRPLIACFRKLPTEQVGGQAASNTLAFVITPSEEFKSVAWKISVVWDLETPREKIDKWNQIFVGQDKEIVEAQRPKAMPLNLKAEKHQRCDQSSVAYRRWLEKKGLTYGVTT